MRYKIAAVAAVLACGGVVAADADDVPVEKYVSKEGGYVAYFPVGADIKAQTVPAPGGLKAYMTTALLKAKQLTYIVTYTPHEKGVLKAPAKTILDLGEKATLAQPKVLKLDVKSLTVGKEKYPAREILTDRDGHQTRTRFVAADPTLYTLTIGGPKEFASSKAALDFLDTFEIVPPGKVKGKK
jgi:hypothetical protein